jgi:hypothetical protein
MNKPGGNKQGHQHAQEPHRNKYASKAQDKSTPLAIRLQDDPDCLDKDCAKAVEERDRKARASATLDASGSLDGTPRSSRGFDPFRFHTSYHSGSYW